MTTVAASTTNLGILCAIGAATAFSFNDMAIKFLSGDYPLHQIVFVRATIGLIITLAVFAQLEGGIKLRTQWPWHHAFRAALLATANMLFFTSIASMPLADATAIFFVSPLLITGMSVIFLKEVVGPRRWLCVIVGLIGVLIIVGPGRESFQIVAILPALAAL
ncbi:MAG: DMT family transporter, partial [Paracoccaceae bacterium]|nr:DMT family transporter [Paracoccaceae bacterium]